MIYQRVTVGTDGSIGAATAVWSAARIAAACEAELIVVSAYDNHSDRADEALAKAQELATAVLPKVTARRLEGDPSKAIAAAAEEDHADLVVVGNRGMTGGGRFLLGSVPDRVSHQAPCDLLITTPKDQTDLEDSLYRKMVIGTDGSETSIEAAGRALALADRFGAEPVMFYAGHPKTAEIVFEEVWGTLKLAREFSTAVMSGDPAEVICEIAQREGFDLIVVGNRGMTQGRFRLGNVPNKVSHRAPCDLLIVKTVSRSIEELRKGEGAILTIDGAKVAAYREPGGEVHLLSPRCQHMGCTVGWNPVEGTWDCPCHGSRYHSDGTVLRGPTTKPLVKFEK